MTGHMRTMTEQHRVFVHDEKEKFRVKPNEPVINNMLSSHSDDELPSLKNVERYVTAIDEYSMWTISGTSNQGACLYAAWVKANAKVGKRLLVLRRRAQKQVGKRKQEKKTNTLRVRISKTVKRRARAKTIRPRPGLGVHNTFVLICVAYCCVPCFETHASQQL